MFYQLPGNQPPKGVYVFCKILTWIFDRGGSSLQCYSVEWK